MTTPGVGALLCGTGYAAASLDRKSLNASGIPCIVTTKTVLRGCKYNLLVQSGFGKETLLLRIGDFMIRKIK